MILGLLKIDVIGNGTDILSTGYKPDVFYEYDDMLIIGEAKTSNDIDKMHSINQYSSFLKYCEISNKKASFIINTPWMDSKYVLKIFKKIKKENEYKTNIIILNDMGRVKNI